MGFVYRWVGNNTMNHPEVVKRVTGRGPDAPPDSPQTHLGYLAADLVCATVQAPVEAGVGTGGGLATAPTGVGAVLGVVVDVHAVLVEATALVNTVRDTISLAKALSPTGGGKSTAEPKKDAKAEEKEKREKTPTTHPGEFENVKGKKGKINKENGEVWEKDKFHKDHYEVYKDRKNYEKGRRDRDVWEDGRPKRDLKK